MRAGLRGTPAVRAIRHRGEPALLLCTQRHAGANAKAQAYPFSETAQNGR